MRRPHYGKDLGDNHKYDLLPDYIIYSSETDYDDSNAYYCAGFFDTAWQLDPKLRWTADGKRQPMPGVPFPGPEPRLMPLKPGRERAPAIR